MICQKSRLLSQSRPKNTSQFRLENTLPLLAPPGDSRTLPLFPRSGSRTNTLSLLTPPDSRSSYPGNAITSSHSSSCCLGLGSVLALSSSTCSLLRPNLSSILSDSKLQLPRAVVSLRQETAPGPLSFPSVSEAMLELRTRVNADVPLKREERGVRKGRQDAMR